MSDQDPIVEEAAREWFDRHQAGRMDSGRLRPDGTSWQWDDLSEWDRQAFRAIVRPTVEVVRTKITDTIEGHYLGPDSGRSFDGRDAPDAHLRNAYDEGLERAARIARGDG